MKTWTCSQFNSTQIVHKGSSTSIDCYSKQNCCLRSKGVAFAVDLRRKHLLCAYLYLNQSWNKQLCNDNIRFVWIPETEQISFDLLNVQINHSADYTCTIVKYFPPPAHCVLIQRTFIQVTGKNWTISIYWFIYSFTPSHQRVIDYNYLYTYILLGVKTL